MKEELVAPCGMNCAVCSAYLASVNALKGRGISMPYCVGCRPRDKQCAFLKKRCSRLLNGELEYCHQCPDFPCDNLKHIDKRYRALYRMSMIDSLECIKQHGIEELLEGEEKKWRFPECGGVICCHNGICFSRGVEELKNRQKLYRWEDD